MKSGRRFDFAAITQESSIVDYRHCVQFSAQNNTTENLEGSPWDKIAMLRDGGLSQTEDPHAQEWFMEHRSVVPWLRSIHAPVQDGTAHSCTASSDMAQSNLDQKNENPTTRNRGFGAPCQDHTSGPAERLEKGTWARRTSCQGPSLDSVSPGIRQFVV